MANEPTPGAVQPPQRRTDELLARLAEQVGARFGVSNVFGAPVERDGVTVLPVASIRFGLGGGSGSDPRTGQEGEGGGAAGSASAAGYIEPKDGRSRFVPVVDPAPMPPRACQASRKARSRVRSSPGGPRMQE
jgi:Sporulation protein YtfJ (Spore_YtfJ)